MIPLPINKKLVFSVLTLILIIFGGMFAFSYFSSTSEKVQDYFFRENIKDSYVEQKTAEQISSEGFESFGYDLSSKDLEQISTEENVELANEVVKDLHVYTFEYDFYTEFALDDYKLTNTQLTYDNHFMSYDFDTKWRNFFGLNLFGDSYYDVVFKADVYKKGYDFPLNYKEDTYFEYRVDNKILQTWDLNFDGSMQLVLPDKDQDTLADNIDLVLEVQVSSKGNEGDVHNKVFEVPLKVRGGEIMEG